MSKLGLALGVVACAAASGALWFQVQTNREVRGELSALRVEIERERLASAALAKASAARERSVESNTAAGAMPTAGASAGDGKELAALREEITALRKSTQTLTAFAQQAQAAAALKASDNTPTRLTPVTSLRNAGRNNPEQAIETMLWAATGGELDTLTQTLTFTPSARAKADAWFATLSDSTRQQYGTPENLIALMIARDTASLTGIQVLGSKEMGDDVGMRVRFAGAEGKTKDESFLFRKGGDGWRLVLPDQAVDNFARKVAGGK